MQLCAAEFRDVWHFRGALDNWILETALERTARNWRVPMQEIPQIEKALIREFMRAYPPDANTTAPDNNDTLAWLSLMQHRGAPTRLLDWSYSPFVAAFFGLDALLKLGCEARQAAVWACPTNRWLVRNTSFQNICNRRSKNTLRPATEDRFGQFHGCRATNHLRSDR